MSNALAAVPQSDRDTIILRQLPQVHLIARQLQRRLPAHITLEDLISVGTIGLIQSISRFDSSRGCKLNTFAERRIRGAMLDLLRKEDPAPRRDRQKFKRNQGASVPRLISLEYLLGQCLQVTADAVPPQFAAVCESERAHIFQTAMQELTATEQQILRLLREGATIQSISQELSLKASHVAQLRLRVLARARHLVNAHLAGSQHASTVPGT